MKHTKEQLEKLSDFELSSMILSGNLKNRLAGNPFQCISGGAKCMITGVGSVTYHFNINNWADMGALIQESGIDIEWPEACLGSVGTVRKYISNDTDIFVEFRNKSDALKAAAIVYLLMQEGE